MQKVFENIIEKLEEYKYENLVEHDSEESQHCKDVGDCDGMDCSLCVFDKAIEIVKQESDQYNNGWIPCSERLPEANQMVLATEKDSVILCCYEFIEGHGYCFYGSNGNVIAWQPLPEPYQPKGENNENS